MPVPHNLAKDLPELREQLEQHAASDTAFARTLEEYRQLDERICGLEEKDQPANDDQINQLRRQRVLLKDKIEQQLRNA